MRFEHEHPLVRSAGYFLLGLAAVTAVTTLRLMSDGNAGLERAERAMENGDRDAAIAALEDAAKAYVPGGRHVPRALKELTVLARAAEIRGEAERTLKTWEVIRRSVLATRHFFQPNKPFLADAEKAIVRLHQKNDPAVFAPDLIKRPIDPSPLLSLLLFFGLAAWIAGASLWVLCPVGKKGAPLVPKLYSIAISLGGLFLWLLCAGWV